MSRLVSKRFADIGAEHIFNTFLFSCARDNSPRTKAITSSPYKHKINVINFMGDTHNEACDKGYRSMCPTFAEVTEHFINAGCTLIEIHAQQLRYEWPKRS